MNLQKRSRTLLVTLAAFAAPLAISAAQAQEQSGSALTQVVEAPHQMTGVTVSEDGRIFVNFPRWTEDAPISVAEVVDGELRPYPDAEWNSWRNARKNEVTPGDHWVSVQSVVADGKGSLWVLDPAAPATAFTVPGGPKLVRIDLKTNEVVQTIAIPESVAPRYSYLNDVRFSPDGGWAFITDSGANGALVVVGLQTGNARRLLDGHPIMQPEPNVVVKHEGQPIRRPDGRGVEFANDSIALSNDGETLYFKALTAKTLYSIPTSALTDENATADTVAGAIRQEGDVGVTDGIWINRDGTLFLTSPEDDAIKVRADNTVRTLIQDERLRWPDTFSEGPDGAIYVTTSRIQDMSWYKPESPIALPTQLWKFDPKSVKPSP